MRQYLCVIGLLFAVVGTPMILGADTVYDVNETFGSGTATGSITTDGTIGTLSLANIVDWNLTLSDGTNISDITPSNSAVFFGNHISGVGNVDVTATSQNLLFNYSGGDAGFISFSGVSGQLCYTSENNCWLYPGVGVFGVAGVGGSVYAAQTGDQIIATTPEPGSFLLFGSGLGIGLMGLRRKLCM